MKQIFALLFGSFIAVGLLHASADNTIQSIPIGSKAPETAYVVRDISGIEMNLEGARKENGLLVIFSCNTCPFVIGWEDRYIPLGEWCAENNVGFVIVNSNEAKRGNDDSIEKMREHAAEKQYNTFYLVDENHVLADAFGATRTPEVFLFDSDMTLVYKGAIDDNMEDPNAVEKPYLATALKHMLSGLPIDPESTKSVGCTIKRVKK